MRPALLATILLAMNPPPPPAVQRYRCKFCKAALEDREAAQPDHVVHPGNRCRYGTRGNCAAPVEHVERLGFEARRTPPIPSPRVLGAGKHWGRVWLAVWRDIGDAVRRTDGRVVPSLSETDARHACNFLWANRRRLRSA